MTPTADLVLTPVPKQVELTTGAFQPPRPLLDALRRYDGSHGPVPGVQIIVGRSVSENGSENGLTRDSYSLEVQPSGVTITAPAPQGAFYGMMTLRQIVRQSRADHVPCLRIRDWPDYPNRGIMLDISRDRVPTMDTIYRLIDLWSELKINQLQLYTEHTFAYARHPKVWQGASPMTAEEIRLIDGYCRDRFIELVPNQNSFGHMERWLKHPEYLHLAEAPDGFNGWNGLFQREPFSLSPSVPESVPFLAGLYDELLPNFSSTKFNVGCDETIDLGQGRSSRMCREHGTGRVYVDFVNRVYRLVHERGKRMLYWGDVILHYPELITELPKEAIALTWGYEADHPFESDCAAFQTAGVPFYVCAGTSAWNSLGGRWQNARGNLERAAEEGLSHGAEGFLTTEWGDNGHMQQYPVSLPGYLYGAALSWSPRESRDLDVAEALSRHLFDDPSGGIARGLLSLGEVTDSMGVRLHNATVLAAMLIDHSYPHYRERYAEFAGRDFASCRDAIDRAASAVQSATCPPAVSAGPTAVDPARPAVGSDCGTLREEILFTARLMRHACDLAELRLSGGPREVADLEPSDRARLAAELEPLISDYRRLWLARSRPGGLSDSAGRLELLLSLYRG